MRFRELRFPQVKGTPTQTNQINSINEKNFIHFYNSNSFIGGGYLFSLGSTMEWPKKHTQDKTHTRHYLLEIEVDFDESCAEMHDAHLSNSKLLGKTGGGGKQ